MIRHLLFSLFSLLILSTGAFAETIKLRADMWLPYNGDPNSPHPGYVIEIVREVFSKSEHTIDYQIEPWSRAVTDATEGRIDGIVGAARGDAPTFIFPEESVGVTRNTFFVKSGSSWKYTGVESLRSVKLGYILDYSYGDTLDKFIAENKTQLKNLQGVGGDTALEQNIEKLNRGRIDAIVSSPEVLLATLETLKIAPDQFVNAGETPEVDPLYVAFSPKSPNGVKYGEILSKGILELRKSGKLKQILDKYKISDWK